MTLKVLCLDIEGGYGGSSRSLYHSLKAMDRALVAPSVWCRKPGPIQPLYGALGIPVAVESWLPRASALPRISRNLLQLAQHGLEFWRSTPQGLAKLAEAVHQHDLVHFNHEGFALLALWVKRQIDVPITVHTRTNVQPSWFARRQMSVISAAARGVVFITPNEERTFRALGGLAPGRVILNPVEEPVAVAPHTEIPLDGRLKLACISNAALVRGTDRLVEIALALRARGRSDVQFVVAGEMTLHGEWPGLACEIARRGGGLPELVRLAGLQDMFLFLGHVAAPERVLAGSDLLLKPTREANPWGRDIIEAMAAGRPVMSIGTDTTFVETGVTGFLQSSFDPDAMAAEIIRLAEDHAGRERLGIAAKARALSLCRATERAAELATFWRSVASAAGERAA